MFVKYNGVLRGLQSDSPFLKNTMVALCCPREVSNRYAALSMSLEEALPFLNKYTTTLHGINSAIIKLGKLTKATKVYRGIAGMALPDDFWEPNEHGVRGGVEPAFMSTTLNKEVAMDYAAGDGSAMGVVIETQQGMVNRGADISWLSQYPHEKAPCCT
jgi:NLR family CARD domain-containing protein 3